MAVDDALVATQGTPITISVASLLANDSDVDQGTVLAITAVSNPAQGTVVLSDNVITFNPTGSGDGSFQYSLSDGLSSVPGTVTLTIGTRQLGGNGNDTLTGNAGPTISMAATGTTGSRVAWATTRCSGASGTISW